MGIFIILPKNSSARDRRDDTLNDTLNISTSASSGSKGGQGAMAPPQRLPPKNSNNAYYLYRVKNQNLQFFSDIYQNLSVTLEWVNRFKQNLKHKETICQVTVLFNMLTIIINNRCVTMMYSLTTCHNKFLRENFAHPSVMAIFRKLMLG